MNQPSAPARPRARRRPAATARAILKTRGTPALTASSKAQSLFGGLLLLSAAGFNLWNFWAFSSRSHALPSTVAAYTLKPVAQNDAPFYDPATGENTWKYEEFAKNLFIDDRSFTARTFGNYNNSHMNDLQIAKAILGCYGDLSSGALTEKLSDASQPVFDWSVTGSGINKMKRAQMLNYWQNKAVGGDTRTVCGCIDSLYGATLQASSKTAYTTGLATAETATKLVVGTETIEFAGTTKPFAFQFWANSYDEIAFDTAILADPTAHTNARREILDTCIESAEPVHAVAYDEAVPASLYLCIGGLLLVLGALSIYSNFVCEHQELCAAMSKDACEHPDYAKRAKNVRLAKDALLLVVAATALAYILFLDAYKPFSSDDGKYLSFRTAGYDHPRFDALTVIVLCLVSVGAALVLFIDYMLYKRDGETGAGDMCNNKWLLKGSVSEEIAKHIANDVLLIAGFGVAAVGVLAQADVSSSTSLVGGTLLIVVLGFLQHISNVVKCVYTRICERLESQLVVDLTMHDTYQAGMKADPDANRQNPGAFHKVSEYANPVKVYKLETIIRPALQYFGWSRVYIFITVILGTLAFMLVARDSAYPLGIHNMLEGQMLYFALAFLVVNVGFDAVYELLPFMFEGTSSEWLRCYSLLFYVALFNLNQLLYYYKLPVPS